MAGKKISQLSSGSLLSLPLSGLTAVVYSGITYQHSLSNLRQTLVDSGSHVFTGSQVINGNLTISGSITAQQYILSSSITNITTETISGSSNFGNSSDDKHTFTGSVNITGSLTSNNIIVGPISEILSGSQYTAAHIATSNSINIVHFEGNDSYYSQVNITNTNSGNNASSDLVLTADNGTENVHFVNLGINSSTYTGGLVGRENDAYLLNVGKDLYIGTVGGVNHPAKLYLFAEDNWENPQITIHTGSQVTFNTSSFTSGFTYEFNGNVKLQDELKVDGSITSSYFIGDGSQLTNLPVQSTDVSMFLSSSTFNTFTSSYDTTSASFDSRIIAATNEQNLSHLATTGSNTFTGNQTISGSKYLAVETIQNLSGSLNLITAGSNVEILASNLNVPNGGIITNYNVSASSLTGSLDWLHIINEPSLISGSSQISNLGYAITGSNTFKGYQIISGSIYMGTGSIVLSNGTEIYDTGNSGSTSGIGLGNNGFNIDFGSNVNDWAIFQNARIIQMAPTDQFTILITSAGEYAWNFNALGMGFPDGTNQTTAYPGPIETGSFAVTGSNTFIGDQTINGSLIIEGVSEVITVDGGFNGNRTFDYTSGSIFYLTGLTGNGVWNIQNVPTTSNKAIALTYVIEQGVTPYSGSQYQINDSNITVKWVDNTIPTGSANNTEVIGLTAFRVGSSWNVIGSLSTFGV